MIARMRTTSTAPAPMPAAPTAVRQARLDRGLSQAQVIEGLTRIAQRRGIALSSPESIRSRLSAWENGRATPDSVSDVGHHEHAVALLHEASAVPRIPA